MAKLRGTYRGFSEVEAMQLTKFHVQNFRSVNDSGPIDVRQRTALVGRNESGKTSLLLALESLNPPDRELKTLSYVKDFPRDRSRTQFSEDLPVVGTTWELSPEERQDLVKVFPRAKDVTEVTVSRPYKDRHIVGFSSLPDLTVDHDSTQSSFVAVQRSVTASFRGKEAAATEPVKAALSQLSGQLIGVGGEKPTDWAARVVTGVAAFRQAVAAASHELPEGALEHLTRLDTLASGLVGDSDARAKAEAWVVEHMPIFIYLSEYPELEGHQNVPAYLQRVGRAQQTEADENFGKLMKVAGLDAEELNDLLAADHEQRQQLANRAGAVVTKQVRALWKDRQLKVRFNLDAQHFDTLVSDPASVYDVEINLNERSRGFKWFFSFYVTFAADTAGGPAEQAVLLFDEPALYLHAVAQQDLLDHFKREFKNTIIYTTHSPFMVPVDDLASVRTVNISAETGTTVTNDPTGDSKTLFPLRTALGYEVSQTLFIGPGNLVVEGVSDFWYLSSVSEYIAERGGKALPPRLVTTPAGGAQKVSYMVSLLTANKLNVLVLLDSENQARRTAREDLIKSKLIREESVIFVTDALGTGATTTEADIEDLLDPAVYAQLVQDTYKAELAGKKLPLNPSVPRIVRRYEQAFEQVGLEFNKTRPARLFLRRIAEAPDQILPVASRERFERLFKVVGERLESLTARQGAPFR
jgi:energy-coupling factor transporter ATP-binding protein EcfA2